MTSKIFRSTVLVAVIVLLCSLGVVMGILFRHFTGVQVQQLKDELSLAVTGTEQYGNAFLENVEASGGTGLGMSIVKHAVQYHKATMGLQSTPGKGTTIAIQF